MLVVSSGPVRVNHTFDVPIVPFLLQHPFGRAVGGRPFSRAHLEFVQVEEAGRERVPDLPREAFARYILDGQRATVITKILDARTIQDPVLQGAPGACFDTPSAAGVVVRGEAQETLVVPREAGSPAPRLRPLPARNGRHKGPAVLRLPSCRVFSAIDHRPNRGHL